MEVWATNFIVMILLVVVPILAGLIPLKLFDYMKGPGPGVGSSSGKIPMFELLNSFAGGAFLGTLMLHLQPYLEQLTAKAALTDTSLPLEQILIALGFFFMFFIEQILVHISNKRQLIKGMKSTGSSDKTLEDISEEIADSMLSTDDVIRIYRSTDPIPHGVKNVKHRYVILLVALSTHSLFEGLAIGLQDLESVVWTMFVATALHKTIISFSSGVQLVKTYHPSTTPVFAGIMVYSLMLPLGAALGTLMQDSGGNRDDRTFSIVILVLQGLATGTFMFITLVEILVKNLRSGGTALFKIFKIVAVFLGFASQYYVLPNYGVP